MGGQANNVLNTALQAGKLANIFGQSPIGISAIFDPGQPDHGNLEISWNVKWDAGQLTGQLTGTNNSSYIVSNGRNMTTHPVTFSTAFTSVPLVFAIQGGGNASGHASIDRIWAMDETTSGCTIVVAERTGSNGVTLNWFAIQPDTMT